MMHAAIDINEDDVAFSTAYRIENVRADTLAYC
jgi:hypothetical protein